MERHALLFRVKPGSEASVAEILGGYERPATTIDDTTRLLGTTVFMYRDIVVRVMEIEGDLRRVIAHLAGQPTIQATEAALNPHLAEPRDLSDPMAARAFFGRAMMKRLADQQPPAAPDTGTRGALLYTLPPDCHEATDAIYERGGVGAGRAGVGPVGAATVFRHGDVVVTIYDGAEEPTRLPSEQPLSVVTDRRAAVA